MPTYKITAPDGRTVKITGDSPPSSDDIDSILSKLPGSAKADPVRDAFMDPKHLYRWGTAGQDASSVHPSQLSEAEQNKGAAIATAGAVLPGMVATLPTTLAGAGRLALGLGAGEVADQGLKMVGAPPWLRMAGAMAVGGVAGSGGKLLRFGRGAVNPLGYTDEAAMSYLKPGAKNIGQMVAQGAEGAAPGVVQGVPMAAQKAAGAIPAASTASVPVSGAAMAPTVENIVAQGAGKAVSGEALAFAEKLQGTVAALKGQGLSPGQIASAVREANPGLGETVARKMVDDILAVQRAPVQAVSPLLPTGSRSMATVGGGKAQPYLGPARVPTDDSDLLALLQSSLTGGR